ncbi:hypothetical protein OESDEN_03265 [Oesophagostomum dentatum]|uniref:Transmembrane protein 107 n=1 Tax=Oesophagostomum dentatum TaxID=61180 RepID=A0A0B1TKZ6_OESDE|nr:hypothetical protein OESDEN_03265 [Oesophagostomum dentatum]
MLDTISGHFLSLLAHIVLVSTLFFNQDPFLLASSPLCVTKVPEDSRVEFVVLLSLTLLVDLGELAILLMKVPSIGLSLLSSFFHAVSCLFLLKFIIDEHPVGNFWVLLALTSVPALIFNLVGFSTYPFRYKS